MVYNSVEHGVSEAERKRFYFRGNIISNRRRVQVNRQFSKLVFKSGRFFLANLFSTQFVSVANLVSISQTHR